MKNFAQGTRALPNAAYRLNPGGADPDTLADALDSPVNKVTINQNYRHEEYTYA